jgi:hypothetical protein
MARGAQNGLPQAMLAEGAVARRKDQLLAGGVDLRHGEQRATAGVDGGAQRGHFAGLRHEHGAREARTLGHGDQIHAVLRRGFLHAGLAVVLVVLHHDRQVRRLLDRDGRERADAHQHLAIAGQHQDAAVRLRERDAQADHGRAPHAAPQRQVQRVVLHRGDVPGRRAEARDDHHVAAIGQQRAGEFTTIELSGRCQHRLSPCRRSWRR